MMTSLLYAFFIYPIEYFIETVYSISINMIPNYGLAICAVSIAVQLLTLPIYKRADAIQDEEREKQKKMSGWVSHIRKTFFGDERIMMLQEYYRIEHYHPLYSLRSSLSILLQIPFFIAAYHFLSNLSELNGNSFSILSDLGSPDALLKIGKFSVNLLPIAMTLINLVSGMIYTRGFALKEKVQLYVTALIFLVLLYNSPSGLVFYWTLNNLFSLFKNIFMKLVKNPRRIIDIGATCFGVVFVIYCWYRGKFAGSSMRLIVYMVFLACCAPFFLSVLHIDKKQWKCTYPSVGAQMKRSYILGSVVMTLLIGLWIPSGIVSVSPAEFVVQGNYVDPNMFVLRSTLVAAGIFLLWLQILFRFFDEKIRILFSCATWSAICVTLLNYFFFSSDLGNMSATLIYDQAPGYSFSEKMINFLITIALIIVSIVILRLKPNYVSNICAILSVVLLILGVINVLKTERTLSDMGYIKNDEYYNENKPELTFSKSGNNVMVLMLDRAIGGYMPYLLREKPELKDKFSGFTYYPNTLSTGGGTITASPALFGGYEYSAYELQTCDDKEMVDKHDEAMRVLPTVFSDNGYDCKCIDIPYPGYGTMSVAELYDDIDNVKGFNMRGYAKTPEQAKFENDYFSERCNHNMIRHSFFIAAPLAFRHGIYHGGTYLSRELPIDYNVHFWALQQYKNITDVADDNTNRFIMMCNDSTHDEMGLQLPDYTEAEYPDNSEYYEHWLDNFSENGTVKVHMDNGSQTFHYMVEMATLLELGRWFDELRKRGVYDNTRIIITSDHGFPLGQFDDLMIADDFDAEGVNPIFLYKDFGSDGFSISNDFMVNADAPLLAMDGIVKSEMNPYTGTNMRSVGEKSKKEGVIVSNIGTTERYTIKNSIWYRVKENIFDKSNWSRFNLKW